MRLTEKSSRVWNYLFFEELFPDRMQGEIAGVPRSVYYKWKRRRTNSSEKQRADQFIMSKVLECEKDPDVNGNYGYSRVQTWLKRNSGLNINHKRVYRLMKKLRIQAKVRKKKWIHFGIKDQHTVSENQMKSG